MFEPAGPDRGELGAGRGRSVRRRVVASEEETREAQPLRGGIAAPAAGVAVWLNHRDRRLRCRSVDVYSRLTRELLLRLDRVGRAAFPTTGFLPQRIGGRADLSPRHPWPSRPCTSSLTLGQRETSIPSTRPASAATDWLPRIFVHDIVGRVGGGSVLSDDRILYVRGPVFRVGARVARRWCVAICVPRPQCLARMAVSGSRRCWVVALTPSKVLACRNS